MAAHAKLFPPSSSGRWKHCQGAPALERHYPNTSSKYADEGTAAHTLGADCLIQNVDASHFLGRVIEVVNEDVDQGFGPMRSSRSFTVDDSMALNVQVYLDLVRSYVAQGYTLLVEQRVSFLDSVGLPELTAGKLDAAGNPLVDLAADGYGTSDAILISPDGTHLVVIDLKYGQGVKVFAENNDQMLTYGLGTVETFALLGSFEKVTLVICQPRIDHIDVWDTTLERVMQHAQELKDAMGLVLKAIERNDRGEHVNSYLAPSEKACTFCKAEAQCPALAKLVAQTVFDDFEALDDPQKALIGAPPKLPDSAAIGAKLALLDLIEDWITRVRAEGERLIFGGVEVIGTDGLPMKTVEGKKGNRAWKDEKVAEGLLVGALPPEKAYKPREVITPSAADKLLNKKKTRETWVQFMDQITQAPGKPKIALGSDPRPPYTPEGSTLDDFVDLSDPTE